MMMLREDFANLKSNQALSIRIVLSIVRPRLLFTLNKTFDIFSNMKKLRDLSLCNALNAISLE